MSCGKGPLSQLTLTELLPSSRQRDATCPGRNHRLLPALAKNMPLACFLNASRLKEGGFIKEGSSRFLERIPRRESLSVRQIQIYAPFLSQPYKKRNPINHGLLPLAAASVA